MGTKPRAIHLSRWGGPNPSLTICLPHKGVLNGIGDQFFQHQGERSPVFARKNSEKSFRAMPDRLRTTGGYFGDQRQHPREKNIEAHVMAEPLGDGISDDGNCHDSAHVLAKRVCYHIAMGSARLNRQQRGDGLKVVFHAVAGLTNCRVLGDISRSRSLTWVTSRTKTTAPLHSPAVLSGRARSGGLKPSDSPFVSNGTRPVTTKDRDSSTIKVS